MHSIGAVDRFGMHPSVKVKRIVPIDGALRNWLPFHQRNNGDSVQVLSRRWGYARQIGKGRHVVDARDQCVAHCSWFDFPGPAHAQRRQDSTFIEAAFGTLQWCIPSHRSMSTIVGCKNQQRVFGQTIVVD